MFFFRMLEGGLKFAPGAISALSLLLEDEGLYLMLFEMLQARHRTLCECTIEALNTKNECTEAMEVSKCPTYQRYR